MSSSRLVLQRYTELLSANELEAAFNYLAEDVIYVTWLGVVEGKDNVVTFLRDNIRYMHHNRNFDRWQQVQHCLDADLLRHRDGAADAVFDDDGYDAQGYATFERNGTVSKHLRLSLERIRVKETIVIHDSKVHRSVKMKATATEREREIEASIAILEREVAALEQEKGELQSAMAVTNPEMRQDELLASFPVLDYCGKRPRQSIRTIPVEQYGNTIIQLELAKKAIESQNQRDRFEIQDLRRLIREQEKQQQATAQKTERLAEEAGIDLKSVTERRRGDLLKMHTYESDISLAELEARKRLVDHEVKAAKIIAEKKGAAIVALTKLVEKRRSTIDEVDALYNKIRIVDRDTTVANEELARMSAEVQDADAWLEARPDPADTLARKVIDEDAATVKGEREQTVNEQRIPQERVIKAQDYRIAQLEKRAKIVDKALKSNGLSREVDKIVARGWSQREVEVPEEQEELYDIEKIIPAQEKIHPGVYNLLLTEKEKTARTVSILTISAKEKEEVSAALTARLESLAAQCNAAIQELDNYASDAAFSEEQQRVQALKWVREQREHCAELSQQKALLENAAQDAY